MEDSPAALQSPVAPPFRIKSVQDNDLRGSDGAGHTVESLWKIGWRVDSNVCRGDYSETTGRAAARKTRSIKVGGLWGLSRFPLPNRHLQPYGLPTDTRWSCSETGRTNSNSGAVPGVFGTDGWLNRDAPKATPVHPPRNL